MHQLKIVHSDIKPANIMWSPKLNKNVMLDYGLCEFINEDWG
jgi:serine/threonine protein kinase